MVRRSMSEVCWRALPGAILLAAAACGGSSAEPVIEELPPAMVGDAGVDAPPAPPGDECKKLDCGEHAACVVDDDAARCVCDTGFVMRGARCEPETAQTVCNDVPCSGHGECSERAGLPVCICDEGYHADKLDCVVDDPTDPCSGVTCGPHGDCVLDDDDAAECTCEVGYHAEGLTCVKDAVVDLCAGITCSGHGTCNASSGAAACACATGYHAEGLTCVQDSVVDPCAGITCSGHGTCNASSGAAACACTTGYHAEGLTCVKDVVVDPCAGITCGGHGLCQVTDGVASCACAIGYAPSGLTCAPSEYCDPIDGIDCLTGRAISSCCLGDDCYYGFADGKKLQGVNAALGYCYGETNGSVDGNCAGIAVACSTLGAATCGTQTGCTWYASLGLCSGAATCSAGYQPSSCNAVQGCYWSAPAPDRVGSCGAQQQGCVAQRRYRACADDDGYFLFENGTKLRGVSAAAGYCGGRTTGTEDGECGGVAASCDEFASPTSCAAQGCFWYSSGFCGGSSRCSIHPTSAQCDQVMGCDWQEPEAWSTENCGRLEHECVTGRRYRACSDPNSQGYYHFEDGKALYGASAAFGYCIGETNGVSDGDCARTPGTSSGGNCWSAFTPSACRAAANCTWTPAGP